MFLRFFLAPYYEYFDEYLSQSNTEILLIGVALQRSVLAQNITEIKAKMSDFALYFFRSNGSSRTLAMYEKTLFWLWFL